MPVGAASAAKLRRITKANLVTADIGNQTELVRHDSFKLKEEIGKIIERL